MQRHRPGNVTTFAVFNLILGGMLLICGIVDMQESKVEVNGKDLTQEKKDFLAREIPAYATYRVEAPVLTLALSVGLMVSAVGMLLVQSWGRFLAIGIAGVLALYYVFDTIYQITLVNPGVAKFTNTTDFKAGGFVAAFRTVFIVGWALVVVAYSIVLLLGMLGSRAARAFRGEYDPAEDRPDRRRYRGDDDDDRPRRRSRRRADDEDDEDDRSRRRRPDRDDDIQASPRRRPRRDDDD